MMKKFMLIALTAFAACHAQDPVSTQAQPSGNSIQINCQNFELDREAQLICAYWKDSGKLAAPINLDYFTQIYEVNYIRDLSPPDYAFYANTEAKYLGDTYKVYVYPNSWVVLEHPTRKAYSPLADQIQNESHDLICQNERCKATFLWEFSDESIAGEHPEIEEKRRRQYENLLSKLTKVDAVVSTATNATSAIPTKD